MSKIKNIKNKIEKGLETKVKANLDSSLINTSSLLKVPKKKEIRLPDTITNSKNIVTAKDPVMPKMNFKNKTVKSLPKLNTTVDKSTSSVESGTMAKTKNKKNIIELPPNDETYFVYLNAPLEYRRHLLESSRKVLFCLKSHQKIMLIRQKKFEELKKLRASLKELLYLNKQFKDKLPKYPTELLNHTARDIETNTKMPVKNKATPIPTLSSNLLGSKNIPIEKTELEKLEDSLANIEFKLKNL